MKKQENDIKIPDTAKKVLIELEKNGFNAHIVGGFVRDIIRHKNSEIANSDIDITTNALPNEIEQVFGNSNWTTYPLGKKYGTIGVREKSGNEIFEITTYRTEQTYSDGRHPDKVSFAKTIDEDLSRRDFTCNAIACDSRGNLCDPFGGITDINNKVIKCVGKPNERFAEDHLRILRALRFSAQLGFNIDAETEAAIRKMKDTINSVSAERIREEMTKLLCGQNAKKVLTNYSDVTFEIIPELSPLYNYDQHTKYHSYDAWTHTLITLDKMPPTEIGRWAALLHDIGKPDCFTLDENDQGHFYGHPARSAEISREILKRLKFANKAADSILLLIRWHDQPMAATKKSVKKMLRKFAEVNTIYDTNKMFRIYCDIRRSDSYAHAQNYQEYLTFTDEIEKVFEQIIAEDEAFSLHDLAISGKNVMDLGVPQGPKISEILNACLDAVINEEIPNTKAELLAFAKTQI